MDVTSALRQQFGDRLRENEPLHRHTNFRIGGPARWYIEARTLADVVFAVETAAKAGVRRTVIGGGSNVLASDEGFSGIVIQMAIRDIRIDRTFVIAGAGAITAAVAKQASDSGLSGLEWAIGLPGTVGGAIFGNAGCFGGEMKDVIQNVSVLEMTNPECRMTKLSNVDCVFGYRRSMFKEHPELVIVEATLQLTLGDVATSRARMEEILARRKSRQPLEHSSAGCVFANVEERDLDAAQRERLDATTEGEWRRMAHDGQIPVGWLIDRAGCKGLRVGEAMTSERHGNFIVNLGQATAADVVALIAAVRARVLERFGVELHEEVRRIGINPPDNA
ncbi:MAG: UDP-N-acetylmuramate dehydrogenase [Candidatus Uhrbacteria bacterium]